MRLERVELDLDRYELRRGGRRITLERLPMELFILLVRSQGALVSRDAIIEKLWGKNPYLDADTNINTAVGKIRRALRDDPDEPRFVETVVGKGYRLAARVCPAGSEPNAPGGGAEIVLISSSPGPGFPSGSRGHPPDRLSPTAEGATALAPRPIVVPMPSERSAPAEQAAPEDASTLHHSHALGRRGWALLLAAVVLVAIGITYYSSSG